jgi:hypothetical protein
MSKQNIIISAVLGSVHIGKIIQREAVKRNWDRDTLAKKVGLKSGQGVWYYYKKKNIDTNMLIKFSIVFDTNLFEHYTSIQLPATKFVLIKVPLAQVEDALADAKK